MLWRKEFQTAAFFNLFFLLNASFYCFIESSEPHLALYSLALQKRRLIALVPCSVSLGQNKPGDVLMYLGCCSNATDQAAIDDEIKEARKHKIQAGPDWVSG